MFELFIYVCVIFGNCGSILVPCWVILVVRLPSEVLGNHFRPQSQIFIDLGSILESLWGAIWIPSRTASSKSHQNCGSGEGLGKRFDKNMEKQNIRVGGVYRWERNSHFLHGDMTSHQEGCKRASMLAHV